MLHFVVTTHRTKLSFVLHPHQVITPFPPSNLNFLMHCGDQAIRIPYQHRWRAPSSPNIEHRPVQLSSGGGRIITNQRRMTVYYVTSKIHPVRRVGVNQRRWAISA